MNRRALIFALLLAPLSGAAGARNPLITVTITDRESSTAFGLDELDGASIAPVLADEGGVQVDIRGAPDAPKVRMRIVYSRHRLNDNEIFVPILDAPEATGPWRTVGASFRVSNEQLDEVDADAARRINAAAGDRQAEAQSGIEQILPIAIELEIVPGQLHRVAVHLGC